MNVPTVLATAAGGGALLWGASYLLQNLYDRVYERFQRARWDHMNYQAQRHANELAKIRIIEADAHGNRGIAYDGRVYRDLDTRAVFDQVANLYFHPILEQLQAQHKLLLALAGVNGSAASQALESTSIEPPTIWPNQVSLAGLFVDKAPSIHDLVIGVRPGSHDLDVVSLSLHDLMHTLIVGASGWGKSTWLRSLLWQIAKAREPIELVAIDISGSEFNVLGQWGKLRYPVARTNEDAIAILDAVVDEIDHRKRMFEDNAPVASKLTEYNDATGADVPPWLVVIDEGTNLLNQPGIGQPIRSAVQTARQYGVYCLVAGQSANHTVVPTQVRDNFTSRLCCRTSPTSSRVVLDAGVASNLTVKGRMWAQLTGRELVELQGPFVGRDDLLHALGNGGPRQPMPAPDPAVEAAEDHGLDSDQIERIIDLWTGGMSYSAVADEVFVGGRNKKRVDLIRAIIESINGE